jgi:hypothetical protein
MAAMTDLAVLLPAFVVVAVAGAVRAAWSP